MSGYVKISHQMCIRDRARVKILSFLFFVMYYVALLWLFSIVHADLPRYAVVIQHAFCLVWLWQYCPHVAVAIVRIFCPRVAVAIVHTSCYRVAVALARAFCLVWLWQ